MTLDPVHLRDFALRYTAAWCSQDPAQVAAFFSPNASLTVNGGVPAVGRAAIISGVVQGFMAAFPDLHLAMDDIVIKGDRAEFHWTLTGTNSGPGGTGQQVRISGHEEWRMGEDGLVAESQGCFDAAEYERQLHRGAGDEEP